MWKDPIVQEVRKIREANAKKLNYNVKNIVEDTRKIQDSKKNVLYDIFKNKEC